MAISSKEFVERLKNFTRALESSEPMFNAVSNSIRDQTIRVFEDGGVGEGGSTAAYRGGPLYVNPDTSRRKFPLKGKNGGGPKFTNGNQRKSSYFTSYAEFKRAIGEPANVNLRVFGNLARAYGTGISIRNSGGEVRVFHSIRLDASNTDGKIRGLIAKYPAAFKPTRREIENFTVDLQNYADDLRVRSGL